MSRSFVLLLACLLVACAHPASAENPRRVTVPSGTLNLTGLLWTPPGNGPFPAILFNHGRPDTPDEHLRQHSAEKLGPLFARHGYLFLYLFRRGEGLSADQGRFIGHILEESKLIDGDAASRRLQLRLLQTDHLADGMAGVAFLKHHALADPARIAVVGHSFGGQLALLEAEQDRSIGAVVSFGPAARSWAESPELQARLLKAVRELTAPVLILHPENDYSTDPGRAMDAELTRLGKRHELKIYPPFGTSAGAAHSFLYADITIWEADVFRFLDGQLGGSSSDPKK